MTDTTPTLIELAQQEQAQAGGLVVPYVAGATVRSSQRCPRCGGIVRVEFEGAFTDRYDHGGLEYWRWAIERTPTGAVALARTHNESRTYGGRSTGVCGLRVRQLNGSPRSAVEQLYDGAFGRDVPHIRIDRFDLDALRAAPWTALAVGSNGAAPIRLIADDHALRFAIRHGRMPETVEEYDSIGPWTDAPEMRELAAAFLAQIGAKVVEIP
jgi:hypothetical protein